MRIDPWTVSWIVVGVILLCIALAIAGSRKP